MQPPPTRRRKSRRNSTRSLRNAPGPLTRQLSVGSMGAGLATPAQTTPRPLRRQMSEGSASGSDTASLASGDSGIHHYMSNQYTSTALPLDALIYS